MHDIFQLLMQLTETQQTYLGNNVPFGGITVVFRGDFCQTLPVIQRAVHQQIVASTLCRGKLWKDIEVCYLIQNMHLERTPESVEHAKWLLDWCWQ